MSTETRSLVVAISSRALFDLRESHAVFEKFGLAEYAGYQVERENEFLPPGVAFPLVRKLLALNEDGINHPGVEVILLSRNSADTGLRIFNTIEHYGLNRTRRVYQRRQPLPIHDGLRCILAFVHERFRCP